MRRIRSNRKRWREELLIVYDLLVTDQTAAATDYLMMLLFDAREGYRRVLGRQRD